MVARLPAADGQFVYSVATTGVYCRPSCPSRQPLRANVRFHDSCADAERAGFRPCKRCQPNGASVREELAARMADACRAIDAADEPPGLEALARAAGMSRYHFQRTFLQIVGVTPKAYATARRADRARAELPAHRSVTAALYESGFQSSGRFYEEAPRTLGMRPGPFRAGGEGEVIRFAVGASSLGAILVAAASRGICAIALGDDADGLVRELQERFAAAELRGGEADFERFVAAVVGFAESPARNLELPLDLRGTVFQRKVWDALRKLPLGTTTSYSALAARLGMPRGARAVARACTANPIALAVPCHRVVRTDGGLSGYRWGVARKRELLRRERQNAVPAPSRVQ